MPRIGIDLGATNIRVGLLDDQTLVRVEQASTPTGGSEQDVLDQIYALLDRFPTGDAASIGAGVPSVVDVDTGVVYDVQNIPSWTEVPLGARLRERYGVPVHVQNDANCFALAAYHFETDGQRSPMVGLILGTGLGGGIVVNGDLLSGRNCGAGEFGTMLYKDSIYEHYCAGLFFEREHDTTGEAAFERAQAGDEAARLPVFQGRHVGRARTVRLSAGARPSYRCGVDAGARGRPGRGGARGRLPLRVVCLTATPPPALRTQSLRSPP